MFQNLTNTIKSDTIRPIRFKVCQKKDQNWLDPRQLTLKGNCLGLIFIDQLIKVKIKGEEGAKDTYQIKLTTKTSETLLSLNKKDQKECFIELVKTKILKITKLWPQTKPFDKNCEGLIYRKDFFGKWQQNYLFISSGGLIVSKEKDNDHHEKFMESIKQLWTRFQFIENNTFMVFKVKNRIRKHEFAVSVEDSIKWMQALCSLIYYQ